MSNVVELNRGKPDDATVEEILQMAGRQNWEQCLCVGYSPAGGFQVLTSQANAGDSFVLLEFARKRLMEFVETHT